MKKIRWILQSLLLVLLLTFSLTGCSTAGDNGADRQETATQAQTGESFTEDRAAGTETSSIETSVDESIESSAGESMLDEAESYTSKEEVALYLHTYGHLPDNYLTKKEAQSLGWDNKAGNLWDVAPDMSIGGDRFGNYEGLLPEADGRKYFECDIDYEGGYRGSKRIIYSNDGLIYYTEDHYESFEQLYQMIDDSASLGGE